MQPLSSHYFHSNKFSRKERHPRRTVANARGRAGHDTSPGRCPGYADNPVDLVGTLDDLPVLGRRCDRHLAADVTFLGLLLLLGRLGLDSGDRSGPGGVPGPLEGLRQLPAVDNVERRSSITANIRPPSTA
jgi:hypothetical protein